MQGVIKQLFDKGYGFIKMDDGSEIFFHFSAMTGTDEEKSELFKQLEQGDNVEFDDIEEGPKGKNAVGVRKA